MFVIGYNVVGKICHATKFETYQTVSLDALNAMNNDINYLSITEDEYNAVKDSVQHDTYYVDSANSIVPRPTKPSIYHEWDWISKTWKLYRAHLELVKLGEAFNLFTRKCNSPIEFNGVLFDADSLARSRITATLSRWMLVGTLPDGFIGWMDYNNDLQWANEDSVTVKDNLNTIARLIEDREQNLIKTHWELKNVLRNTPVEELLNADVEAMWNSIVLP